MPDFRFLTPIDAELLEDSQHFRGIRTIASSREIETVATATGFRRAGGHIRESPTSSLRIDLKFPTMNCDRFHLYREEAIN